MQSAAPGDLALGAITWAYAMCLAGSELFGHHHNKDYSVFGSILGSPYFGNLPYYRMPHWDCSILAGSKGK